MCTLLNRVVTPAIIHSVIYYTDLTTQLTNGLSKTFYNDEPMKYTIIKQVEATPIISHLFYIIVVNSTNSTMAMI